MRHERALATALGAVLLAACSPPARQVCAYLLAGREQRFELPPGTDFGAFLAEKDRAALRDLASTDLGCPAGDLAITEVSLGTAYVVAGCGARGEYVRVTGLGLGLGEGRGRREDLLVTRFVPISRGDPAASLRDLEGRHAGLVYSLDRGGASLPTVLAQAGDWVALSEAGARALACPREVVVVRSSSRRTPAIAEGCGKRATFLRGPGEHEITLSAVVEVR